ncbi:MULTISPECIES: hypothetical protein [unclassified Amycolatopsis]|uniref:hypothetical protein n=1 Tax=unclassified Amycolatopsis TaxID=2618356 RepID=UPI001C697EDF|nr:hypothetical protein [Amycolatopsis sp. DSM 110486]QYN21593.1 hypothetical protein K1T34_03350 [Amycolatopsis sp. DSM 110486]
MTPDPATVVPALLAAAGLTPSAEETALMIADFPSRAEAIEKLYEVPEARYEEPGLIFRAEP